MHLFHIAGAEQYSSPLSPPFPQIFEPKRARKFRHFTAADLHNAGLITPCMSIIMRTTRLFYIKTWPEQFKIETENANQSNKEMGGQVSTKNRPKIGHHYGKSSSKGFQTYGLQSRSPLAEKSATKKSDVVALKRRRSYSECDITLNERQNLCKKLRVNQLYTDYCGRNSFMAAFFKLLGK